jgi:hypothetical protein
MAVDAVDDICDRLARQHAFLEPAGLAEGPDGTLSGCYRFQHALYRQVLAARLRELQRLQVQHRLEEHLGQSYAPQLPPLALQLAFQFMAGCFPPPAVLSLRDAG